MRDCQVCGDYRPESELILVAVDRSAEIGMPPGTASTEVWHCPDKPDCVNRAADLLTVGAHYAGADDPAMHKRSTDQV